MNTSLDSSVDRALKLTSHKPGRRVNKTMSALVASVTNSTVGDFEHINTPAVLRLRKVASSTEYELEKYWSAKISRARNSHKALQLFPYTNNYAELVRREVALLSTTGNGVTKQSSVLIVGSGPLPLTYIEIARQTGAAVTLVDSSDEAIELSTAFCESLSYSPTHLTQAAETLVTAQKFDIILLAALVGETDAEKQAAVDNLQQLLHPNGRLVVRSAKNARTLLYPQIATPFQGLTLLAEEHPTDEVINSILIYAKEHHEK